MQSWSKRWIFLSFFSSSGLNSSSDSLLISSSLAVFLLVVGRLLSSLLSSLVFEPFSLLFVAVIAIGVILFFFWDEDGVVLVASIFWLLEVVVVSDAVFWRYSASSQSALNGVFLISFSTSDNRLVTSLTTPSFIDSSFIALVRFLQNFIDFRILTFFSLSL